MKAGTTWLHDYLAASPQCEPGVRKEYHVFDSLDLEHEPYLLGRVEFRPSLDRVRDVLALVALAAVASTLIAATIGVASLVVGDEIPAGDFGTTWRTWWLGDMGGDLLVAPLLMAAAAYWPFRRLPGRAVEAVERLAERVGVQLRYTDDSGPRPEPGARIRMAEALRLAADFFAEKGVLKKLTGASVKKEVVIPNASHWALYEKSRSKLLNSTREFLEDPAE